MKRIVTGSHSGTGSWLVQRISAIVMLLAGGMLIAAWWHSAPFDYDSWHAAFGNVAIKLLVWLMVASLCLHAWIGLRDVLMDYVQAISIRLALEVLVILALTLCVVWASVILWSSHA